MNRLFSTLLALLLIGSLGIVPVVAQVYNGNLTLSNQSQVNNFNYTEVTGNLRIQNSNIRHLSGLSSLTSVGGNLIIANTSIKHLGGFPSLDSIGGNLAIYQNHSMKSLSGFAALNSVDGYVKVFNNSSLNGINGFAALTSIKKFVAIYQNHRMKWLNGFEGLNSVGEYVKIYSNSSLRSVGGFASLQSVGKYVAIYQNHAMKSLNGFASLASVEEYVKIYNNSSLWSLNGFSELTSIGGYLAIYQNHAMKTLKGFSSLESVDGYVSIYNQSSLRSLNGLSSLATVGGYLKIRNNSCLRKFCGLFTLIGGGGLSGAYNVANNAVNPTEADIIADGPCPLPAPSNLYVNGDTAFLPSVRWKDNSIDEDGFIIYRKEGDGPVEVLDTVPANLTYYYDLIPLNNTTYQYSVSAYNGSGETELAGPVDYTSPDPLTFKLLELTYGCYDPNSGELTWLVGNDNPYAVPFNYAQWWSSQRDTLYALPNQTVFFKTQVNAQDPGTFGDDNITGIWYWDTDLGTAADVITSDIDLSMPCTMRWGNIVEAPQAHDLTNPLEIVMDPTAWLRDQIQVGPNPVQEYVQIEGIRLLDQPTTFTLRNQLGQAVLSLQGNLGQTTRLDMSALPTGMYVLQIQAGNANAGVKLLKQ